MRHFFRAGDGAVNRQRCKRPNEAKEGVKRLFDLAQYR
jgi:hypothetical protein